MSESQGKWPDQLFDCRPTCRCDGIRPHSASVLQQDRKSANIHANWGFIWGIPDNGDYWNGVTPAGRIQLRDPYVGTPFENVAPY